MAKDDETPESEELDEEFDEDVELDDDDILDEEIELEDDVELEDLEEEEGPPRKTASDDDLVEMNYEQAIRANPKRAKALKKRSSLIETLLGKAKLDSEDGIETAWETLNEDVDTKIRKPYSITEKFEENMVVEHPTFGVGFVNQILSETKIEVFFEDGLKRLVHNMS